MDECFSKKFLFNSDVKDCTQFNNKLIVDGKSLYEVIRVVKGVPIFLEDHLNRLTNSFKLTNLDMWMGPKEIKLAIKKLIKINNTQIGDVKIIFNFNNGEKNFIAFFQKHDYPAEEMYIKGAETALYNAERQNPNAKVVNISLREAADKIIKERNLVEVILVNKEGFITEGSKSNIFMVKDNKVFTSFVGEVLKGITRDYVIKACNNLGYEVIEKRVNAKEIDKLDGLFISGTGRKVLPICKVDNLKFDPQNKVVQDIRKEYDRIIEEYIDNETNN